MIFTLATIVIGRNYRYRVDIGAYANPFSLYSLTILIAEKSIKPWRQWWEPDFTNTVRPRPIRRRKFGPYIWPELGR